MRTFRILAALVMAVVCVGLSSCSKDDDNDENKTSIVGTWIGGQFEVDDNETLIFNSNNKGKWDSDEFTYTTNSNKVIIDYGDGDPETWTFSISGTTLNMTAEDGVKYLFKKK